MLRITPIASGKRAEHYYAVSDGGYYQDGTGLKSRWIGSGADGLGLTGLTPEQAQFSNLVQGLDPYTGEQMTARLRDNRISGWDCTGCVPKRVTEALECGDERIQPAIWRALERTIKKIEEYATTRVRVDGKQEDRVTGNLVAYAVEHAETRPVEDEALPDDHKWKVMPDQDRHVHAVIFNLTWDHEERKWKAVKFRPIMDLRKFFDRTFDAELAAELSALGWNIKTEFKPDAKGNVKYFSWDIEGVPDSLAEKASRRSRQDIAQAEAKILAKLKEQHGEAAPDELSAVERAGLGGASRRVKRDDLTLGECRDYWASRRTDAECAEVAEAIRRAKLGLNAEQDNRLEAAVTFSLQHHFEKESAVPVEELAITALEHGMGSARLADVEEELKRQGVIIMEKDGRRLATTEALQDEEWQLSAYAMDGRGQAMPIGVGDGIARKALHGETLSRGQWDAALGLLRSTNRVELLLGPAGAGKSKLLKAFDEGAREAGQSVTYLGTTSTSVKVLKKEGFKDTQTLARFLVDEKMQDAARGGRVVIDEISIMGHKQAVELFRVAKKLDLTLICVGDEMQHGSVDRGNFIRLMLEHGRIKPFRLAQIFRQKDAAYRAATQLLSEGKTAEGFDALDKLGFVEEINHAGDRYTHMAADYVQAVEKGAAWNDVLVVAPTHREAGNITDHIRRQLRDAGKLGNDEREFTRLVQVEASEAERGLAPTYRPGDVIQFTQNCKGGFEKGQRMVVTDPAKVPVQHAGKLALYRTENINLAAGDVIRFTGAVKTLGSDHTVRNGDAHVVADFTDAGNIRLDNGWVISGKRPEHFRYGFVETSIGSQGRTVKEVILGMSPHMGKALNMQQLYVSASRSWDRLRLYTDNKDAIRDAAQRDSRKLLALDVKPKTDSSGDMLAKYMERERRLALLKNPFRYTVAMFRPEPPTPPRVSPSHAARILASHQQREGPRL